jgi:hypothetical protein
MALAPLVFVVIRMLLKTRPSTPAPVNTMRK